MSAITKIFTVLNLVFSVAITFFALAYFSKSTDWRKKTEQASAEVATLKNNLEGRKAEYEASLEVWKKLNDAKNSELDRRTADLTQKQSECDKLSLRLVEEKAKVSRAQQEVEGIRQQILAMQSERRELQASLDQKKNDLFEIRERERRAVDAATDLGAQAEALQNQLSTLHADYQKTEEALRNREQMIAELKKHLPPGTEGTGDTAPKINAMIMAVEEGGSNVVILNVGSNFNVKPGYEFVVYRDNSYVGKVKVTDVDRDWSGAVLVQQQHKIKAGDQATTSLSSLQ